MEVEIASNRRQIEMFGPLPLQVALIQKGLDDLANDLARYETAQDKRFERFEHQVQEDLEALARSFSGQHAACMSEIAKVTETMRAHHLAEHERREKIEQQAREDAKDAERSRLEKWIAKYGLVGILGAAAITAAATIINTLIS